MDSVNVISEGEFLSDDVEVTEISDDEYEDGMLSDDEEEGETNTENSNQSDVQSVFTAKLLNIKSPTIQDLIWDTTANANIRKVIIHSCT